MTLYVIIKEHRLLISVTDKLITEVSQLLELVTVIAESAASYKLGRVQ